MAFSRRVVITGMGVISAIGLEVRAFWDSLRAGRTGIRRISAFDPSPLPVQFGGEIHGFDAKSYLDKKDRKRLNTMPRTVQYAVAASRLASADAGLDPGKLDPTRFGVAFGAGTIPGEPADLGEAGRASTDGRPGFVDLHRWGGPGLERMQPLWLLSHVPNMLACHVSILHDARGPNNTITLTDAAGLLALGEACRVLQRDQADLFLVGGADDKVNPIAMVRQCLFNAMSRRNDAPESACRPFDRRRDGAVAGDGAGVLVVEEREHARRRGARVLAEVVGYGAAFDADLDGGGFAQAMRTALAQAGVGPEDLDHVNAHGLGGVADDAREAAALLRVVGPSVSVFAAKPYFGNLGAGSATVELAASLLAFQEGLLPATLNYDEPDPHCPIRVVRAAQPVTRRYFMKVSATTLGQCAAMVCRRPEGAGAWL